MDDMKSNLQQRQRLQERRKAKRRIVTFCRAWPPAMRGNENPRGLMSALAIPRAVSPRRIKSVAAIYLSSRVTASLRSCQLSAISYQLSAQNCSSLLFLADC